MILSLPLSVRVSRKKMWYLNLNQYRNSHHAVKSKAKIVFKEMVQKQVEALPKLNRVSLIYTVYPKTLRRFDVANVCSIVDKFFSDALVECERLPEDNFDHLPSVLYQYGELDRANPRVEVQIINGPIKINNSVETEPMQISLNQTEITKAIIAYAKTQININNDQTFDVEMQATRGSEGFTAVLNVVPTIDETKETVKVVKKPKPVKATAIPKPESVVTEKPQNISTGEERVPEPEVVEEVVDASPVTAATSANPFAGDEPTETDAEDEEVIDNDDQPNAPAESEKKPVSIFNFDKA